MNQKCYFCNEAPVPWVLNGKTTLFLEDKKIVVDGRVMLCLNCAKVQCERATWRYKKSLLSQSFIQGLVLSALIAVFSIFGGWFYTNSKTRITGRWFEDSYSIPMLVCFGISGFTFLLFFIKIRYRAWALATAGQSVLKTYEYGKGETEEEKGIFGLMILLMFTLILLYAGFGAGTGFWCLGGAVLWNAFCWIIAFVLGNADAEER